jgi:hypothetical protein
VSQQYLEKVLVFIPSLLMGEGQGGGGKKIIRHYGMLTEIKLPLPPSHWGRGNSEKAW